MTIASDKDAPYPGLRPYRENEKDKFFGRDADTQILIDKVLTNRLTLLFAASGVGKSSLLQAAIMPHLKSPSGENLSVVYYRDWVSEPLSGVRTAVLMALQEQHLLPDDAEEEGDNLPELLSFCSLFIRSPLVLILDQFEEFFRYQRTQGSFQPFIDQLTLVITAKDLPVNIILSMREDFALELNAFKPRLPTLLFDNFYRLEKLDRESTRKAILTPVENLGYTYEPLLLDLLLDDLLSRELDRNPQAPIAELRMYVEPPYLQIVCAHLWELNKNDPAKTLRLKTYEKVGKAKGILKNYIESALKPFNHSEKLLASRAFDHLISQRGVKMAYTAKALADITRLKQADLQIVLDKLEQLRILRRQARGEETWYELYHDMFSPSLESWNNHFKDELRRRRLLKLSTGLVAGIAAIILGWDCYINVTSHYLKLSPKHSISDQIEVWQDKLGSFDFFHQQHYLAETDFKRYQLEPDKQFERKSLANYDQLLPELISSQAIDERITGYAANGNYSEALKLANHSISPTNKALAQRALYKLAAIPIPQASAYIYQIWQSSTNAMQKMIEDSDNNNTSLINHSIAIVLMQSLVTQTTLTQPINKFWQVILSRTAARQQARELLTISPESDTYQNQLVTALVNSPDHKPVIPPLLKMLDIKEKENTTNQIPIALRALGSLQAQQAIPRLVKGLQDNDWQEVDNRSAALLTLAQLKAQPAIPRLISLLRDRDADIRSSAAISLGWLKAKQAIPNLLPLLQDDSDYIRYNVVAVLDQLQAHQAIPNIIPLLQHKDSWVRGSAAEVLGRLKAKQAIPRLVNALQDKNTQVQVNAGEALVVIKATQAIPDIMRLLNHENSAIQSNAITVLSRLDATQVIPQLITLLQDKNPETVRSTIDALGALKAQQAIPPLIALLQANDIDIRRASINALTLLEAKQAIHPLIALLQDSKVRADAVPALGILQAQQAVPILLPLLQDDDDDVRSVTASAIATLQARQAIPVLSQLLQQDEDIRVRTTAANALYKLKAIQITPVLAHVLQEVLSYGIALNYINHLKAKELIPSFINSDSLLGSLTLIDVNAHLFMPYLFPNMDSDTANAGRIAGGELLDWLLTRLKNPDPYISTKAAIAALRMERGKNINEIEKRLLRKALSVVDPSILNSATEQLQAADRDDAEQANYQHPINQPGLETKPLSLQELNTKLNQFDQAYAAWRQQRDTESAQTTENDKLPSEIENNNKLADPAPFIYEYAFAIAYENKDEGIKLLSHNLYNVREAAARGLANSNALGMDLIEELRQLWLNSTDPIAKQSYFHAIDIGLLAIEGIGADNELAQLKVYEPLLTDEHSAASIKPRVEWTRIQLQWRVDTLQELKALADRQLPDLLKDYCLNPDGSDMPSAKCTIQQ